ncbi:hypothetical protein RB653_009774 [Dictyostelium firmibasis]|uniref:Exosome complex component RRP45 n=1 Tax=Dictyostelium firmibasis TaxID=79012 RepID=A0AAN7YP02_9MYCE
MKEVISKNEKDFVLSSIEKFQRIDGRRVNDMRAIKIEFGKSYGMVEVQLGKTRVFTAITCDIVEPKPERPNEGFYVFNTDISPMSSVSVNVNQVNPMENELGRIIEKGLKESRAIDTEALCIISGSKVWSIKIAIHVLDDCGNLLDCASISVITALIHFRKPDVTVVGNDATIHSLDEREPVPLSIHHTPISITFGFFPNEVMIVDPDTKEESVMDGKLSFLVNIHKEICGVSKGGGTSTNINQVLKCSKIAVIKAAEITQQIRESIHENMKSRSSQNKRNGSGLNSTTKGKSLEMIEHTRPIANQIINEIKKESYEIIKEIKPTTNKTNTNTTINNNSDTQVSKELINNIKNEHNIDDNNKNNFVGDNSKSSWDNDDDDDDDDNQMKVDVKKEGTEKKKETIKKSASKKTAIKKKKKEDSDSEEETIILTSTNTSTTTSKPIAPIKYEEEESEDLSVALKKKPISKSSAKKPATKK